MNYMLNCSVKQCSFHVSVDCNASEAECVEAVNQLKRHLQTHAICELVNAIIALQFKEAKK